MCGNVNGLIERIERPEFEMIAAVIQEGYENIVQSFGDEINEDILNSPFVIGSTEYHVEWFDCFGELLCVMQEFYSFEYYEKCFHELDEDEQDFIVDETYMNVIGKPYIHKYGGIILDILVNNNYFVIANETGYEHPEEYNHLTVYNSPLKDVW